MPRPEHGSTYASLSISLDPSTNIVNARICSWPSYDAKTVSFGVNAGRIYWTSLVSETKPRVVVATTRRRRFSAASRGKFTGAVA